VPCKWVGGFNGKEWRQVGDNGQMLKGETEANKNSKNNNAGADQK